MNKKMVGILLCVLLLASGFGLGMASAEDWPMFLHDAAHTAITKDMAPDSNNVMWSVQLGPIVKSSPAIAKGILYVGTEDGYLYCLDAIPTDDNVDQKLDDPEGAPYDIILRYEVDDAIRSSPAIYGGRLYFGCNDGTLYSLCATKILDEWNYTTGGPITSSPTPADGEIYFGSQDGKIYCLNALNGDHVWDFTTGGPVVSSPAVVDGRVYVGSDDGKIYCLYASNGTEVWSVTTGGMVRSSPAVADGMVFIGSDDQKMYCLDASTGAEIWSFPTGSMIRSSPAAFKRNIFTNIDGKIYFGSDDQEVYCLYSENGTKIWNFTTGDVVRSSPALADGNMYIGSHDGKLYCLDEDDGTEIWSYDTGAVISSSPVVYSLRTYICSEDGNLTCFRDHNPPHIPDAPDGEDEGIIDKEYTFVADTTDPEGDEIFYMFDWGDGNFSEWLGPFGQRIDVDASYKWKKEGYYSIRVRAKDSFGYISDWSENTTIHIKILDISLIYGGLGINAKISNIGPKKMWHLTWSISYDGGRVRNTATEYVDGKISSIPSGESETVSTGPFFQLGKILITITASDNDGKNVVTKEVTGFALGYIIFVKPNY